MPVGSRRHKGKDRDRGLIRTGGRFKNRAYGPIGAGGRGLARVRRF